MIEHIDLSTKEYEVILNYDHSRSQYGHENGMPYVLMMRSLPNGPRYVKKLRITQEFLDQVDHEIIAKSFIDDYENALKIHLEDLSND